MAYDYIDESRRESKHGLPDVEVFYTDDGDGGAPDPEGPDGSWYQGAGWYYAYGQVGCLWDSDPCGPYTTEEEALTAAREGAGYCAHGVADGESCQECPAPELWVMFNSAWGYLKVGPLLEGTIMKAFREAIAESRIPSVGLASALRCDGWGRKPSDSTIAKWKPFGFVPTRLSDEDARKWGHSDE